MTDGLAAAYAPGTRLVEAFARWLERQLGPHGLVVYDASDPAAKPFARSLFKREIGNAGRTARLAAEAGAELASLGYHAQASPAAGSVALFQLDGTRQPIRAVDGAFSTGGRTLDASTLLADVETDPARFSPNVLLRPIVQDTLLPTVAYVAGPNELAYLGQLRRVYTVFDVPMPVIHPRASATIVDAATARFLNRYRVDFAELQPRDDAALNRLLAQQIPEHVERAIASGRAVRGRATRRHRRRRADSRPDAHRRRRLYPGPYRAGAREPARQGRGGREETGFDPAPAVRAGQGAELSGRHPAGTERGRRLFPESLRLRPRRPAAAGAAARPRPPLVADRVARQSSPAAPIAARPGLTRSSRRSTAQTPGRDGGAQYTGAAIR